MTHEPREPGELDQDLLRELHEYLLTTNDTYRYAYNNRLAGLANAVQIKHIGDFMKQQQVKQDKGLRLHDCIGQIQNAVYDTVVGLLERLEHAGLIQGKGHDAAQKIAKEAAQELQSRWNFAEPAVLRADTLSAEGARNMERLLDDPDAPRHEGKEMPTADSAVLRKAQEKNGIRT